jgi:hypothetical protein
MARSAEWLKNAGLALLAIGVLARIGVGLYAASSDPSITLLSWEGLQAVLSPAAREKLPVELRLVLASALPLGAVLWLVGWLVGRRRSPS